jgi:hypothetical protein
LAIADISLIAHEPLRSATTAPPTRNRLQAFLLLISLDLFALFRLRSMGGKLLTNVRPVFL